MPGSGSGPGQTTFQIYHLKMFPGIGVPPGPATEPHVVKGGAGGPKESSGWSPRSRGKTAEPASVQRQ